jgi:hypothetical protein
MAFVAVQAQGCARRSDDALRRAVRVTIAALTAGALGECAGRVCRGADGRWLIVE